MERGQNCGDGEQLLLLWQTGVEVANTRDDVGGEVDDLTAIECGEGWAKHLAIGGWDLGVTDAAQRAPEGRIDCHSSTSIFSARFAMFASSVSLSSCPFAPCAIFPSAVRSR